jgi:hypothetical protein
MDTWNSTTFTEFYVIHTLHFLIFYVQKNQQNALFKYNKIDYKTHFVLGANFDVFHYQASIIREFVSNKGL